MARGTFINFSQAAVVALVSWAGVSPAIADDPTTVSTVRVTTDGGRVVVTDIATGRILYDQRTLKMYNNRNTGEMIVPTIEVVPQPMGMDLVYTYTNSGAATRPLSDMRLGALVMPDELIMQDANMLGGQDAEISHDNKPTIAYTYPSNIYSPVYVLRDAEFAVGVSVLYPLMEYQHDVQLRLGSAPTNGPADQPRGWMLDLRVSTLDGDTSGKKGWVSFPAEVAPGQSKSYTVAVRFSKRPAEWVRTLTPYRDYFRDLYGGVQYDRRDGAIQGYSTGAEMHISANNPFGFRSEKLRPDLHGFGPMVNHLLSAEGWPEVMVVKPTGQYLNNRDWNYPFLFVSQLDSTPQFQTAFDPGVGLASIPRRGRELSLWWGRALQVAAQWDPVACDPLDINNADHRARGRAELEAAARLGATSIGLDCFSHNTVPVWDSYRWLRDMEKDFPQFRFIVEPMASDVLHTLAPTWLRGWEERESELERPEDVYRFTGPHMLADFLLPGHECVLAMRYQALLDEFGIPESQERIDNDAARFASWGFRPEIFTSFNLSEPVSAVESWRFSIPADLQIPESEWRLARDPFDDGSRQANGQRDVAKRSSGSGVGAGGVVSSGRAERRAMPAAGAKPTAGAKQSAPRAAAKLPRVIRSSRDSRVSLPTFTREELAKARKSSPGAQEPKR
ncbi:MAG TPA: hypothetical protein VFF69_11230 [Phycisphaerales bacterium]|nr:hypothetical protein [Phycisphaerales bacterium]